MKGRSSWARNGSLLVLLLVLQGLGQSQYHLSTYIPQSADVCIGLKYTSSESKLLSILSTFGPSGEDGSHRFPITFQFALSFNPLLLLLLSAGLHFHPTMHFLFSNENEMITNINHWML